MNDPTIQSRHELAHCCTINDEVLKPALLKHTMIGGRLVAEANEYDSDKSATEGEGGVDVGKYWGCPGHGFVFLFLLLEPSQ